MSLRGAINAKCRDCIHDELCAGSAAVQIELCASWDTCPLWPVRHLAHRVPYSAPVCAEQMLSPAMAAFRLAHPFTRPPEALDLADSGVSVARAAESGISEEAA